VVLCIALMVLPQVGGKRTQIDSVDLEITDTDEDYTVDAVDSLGTVTRDDLDDFLDGVSSPTQPDPARPVASGNPIILAPDTVEGRQEVQGQEKILRLEEVAEYEAEDYEEEKVEEVCVASGKREESSYEGEQMEADKELAKPADGGAQEPYHECDKIWGTHKSIYPTFFRKWGTAYTNRSTSFMGAASIVYDNSGRRPMFPERLGEFVIQEVRHLEPEAGQHLLLTLRGCTSCENELTETVEWGGLVLMNEDGEYHSTKSINPVSMVKKQLKDNKEQIVMVRNSYDCLNRQDACKTTRQDTTNGRMPTKV